MMIKTEMEATNLEHLKQILAYNKFAQLIRPRPFIIY